MSGIASRAALFLAAAVLLAGCGDGGTTPEWVDRELSVVGSTGANTLIGAVLLSVDAPVDSVDAPFLQVLTREETGRTVLAVIHGSGRTTLDFALRVPGGPPPTFQILQVVDGSNEPVDPADFEVLVEAGS